MEISNTGTNSRYESRTRRKRPRMKADKATVTSATKQKQVSLLTTYLRDYYSLYHDKSLNIIATVTRVPVDVPDMLNYWVDVELGKQQSAKNHRNRDQCIAAKLSWPRTVFLIKKRNVSDDGTLLNLPFSLSTFQGLVSVARSAKVSDVFFCNLTHLQSLRIFQCKQKTITDAAFAHLTNLRSLDMSECTQTTITDCAFVHLTNLQSLKIFGCNQRTITSDAFRSLSNLKSLNMSLCDQETITDAAFLHLTNLKSLIMDKCNQTTITDNAFRHLRNLESLSMSQCNQVTITDDGFRHLKNLRFLNVRCCNQATITDDAFLHLPLLAASNVDHCVKFRQP